MGAKDGQGVAIAFKTLGPAGSRGVRTRVVDCNPADFGMGGGGHASGSDTLVHDGIVARDDSVGYHGSDINPAHFVVGQGTLTQMAVAKVAEGNKGVAS